MNEITTFGFDDHAVRTLMLGTDPWFVGKDVCRCLEIKDYKQAVSRLDDDERKYLTITDALGKNPQEMICVAEPGVYQLVFTSRSPAAKRFKRWLAHEVLPALRQTGRFDMAEADALAQGPVHGWPTPAQETAMAATLNALCRTHGPAAARAYYAKSDFPPLDVVTSAPGELLPPSQDGAGCVKRLLTYRLLNGLSLGEVLLHAWTDDAARQRLAHCGILVAPTKAESDLIAVADRHEVLAEIFEGTPWEKHWRVALLTLSGAFAAPRPKKFGGEQSSCVMVPKAEMAVKRVH